MYKREWSLFVFDINLIKKDISSKRFIIVIFLKFGKYSLTETIYQYYVDFYNSVLFNNLIKKYAKLKILVKPLKAVEKHWKRYWQKWFYTIYGNFLIDDMWNMGEVHPAEKNRQHTLSYSVNSESVIKLCTVHSNR